MTGLSIDTIRAWERRHALVRPVRSGGGARLYSDADVARLELAQSAVALGHPIGRVATLGNSEIQALIDTTSGASAGATLQSSAAAQIVAAIVHAVAEYDLVEAESLLGSAALLFSPAELIIDVLSPLMREIGDGWEAGRISVAQEHCTSNLVRSLLGSVMRLRPPSGSDTIVFATPPVEAHELGLLFAAALASLQGYRALVLGADVPTIELVRAARKVVPSRIVLGVVTRGNDDAVLDYVRNVRHGIPPQTKLSVGGAAAAVLPAASLPAGVDVIPLLTEFGPRVGRAAR